MGSLLLECLKNRKYIKTVHLNRWKQGLKGMGVGWLVGWLADFLMQDLARQRRPKQPTKQDPYEVVFQAQPVSIACRA